MTNSSDNLHTLVLGGTGKTGRRIAEALTTAGRPVRLGSRSAAIPFEWTNRSTWAPAVAGIDAMYIAYVPDLAVPGADETVGELVDLATRAGVSRIVLLSGRGEPGAQRAEQVVMSSGVDATVIRASWFAQNFSEGLLLGPILDGELALPVGDVVEPFIDVADIADVAVAALTRPGHQGQLYEVTGPRLLSFADAAGEIAAASGREIRFSSVPIDDYLAVLRQFGEPEEVVWLIRHLFTEVLDGRNASVADGVQRALGRPPRDFSDYVVSAAATGVWAQQEVPASEAPGC